MKIIIAGSRGINLFSIVEEACLKAFIEWGITGPSEVVSGGASGPDMIGEEWAEFAGVPVKRFPVTPGDWRNHGKAAGPMRNRKMADYADAAIVVWDGVSRGSKNMIEEMKKRGKPVYVHTVRQ